MSDCEMVPLPDLPRYMAILGRAFAIFHAQAAKQDVDGVRFCGHLADNLHNLPELLVRHCNPEAIALYGAFDAELFWRYARSFRKQFRGNARQSMWDYVFEGPIEEYDQAGRQELAPCLPFKRYTGLLYRSLLILRQMAWREHISDEDMALFAHLSGWLQVVPAGLLQWSLFDEEVFWNNIPAQYIEEWKGYLFEAGEK